MRLLDLLVTLMVVLGATVAGQLAISPGAVVVLMAVTCAAFLIVSNTSVVTGLRISPIGHARAGGSTATTPYRLGAAVPAEPRSPRAP